MSQFVHGHHVFGIISVRRVGTIDYITRFRLVNILVFILVFPHHIGIDIGIPSPYW